MGTLSKVKRMSLALPQVLPSLDSFGVAICTHVATALDGGTKCWFELQYSSPAFFFDLHRIQSTPVKKFGFHHFKYERHILKTPGGSVQKLFDG